MGVWLFVYLLRFLTITATTAITATAAATAATRAMSMPAGAVGAALTASFTRTQAEMAATVTVPSAVARASVPAFSAYLLLW